MLYSIVPNVKHQLELFISIVLKPNISKGFIIQLKVSWLVNILNCFFFGKIYFFQVIVLFVASLPICLFF